MTPSVQERIYFNTTNRIRIFIVSAATKCQHAEEMHKKKLFKPKVADSLL